MISALSILSSQFVLTEPATHAGAVDFTWMFIKMLGLLGLVSMLALITLKFAVPRTGLMKRFKRGGRMSIIERMPLEPRKSVYLISACERYFVIGTSEHGISLISEIDKTSIDDEENEVEEKSGDDDGASHDS